METVLSWVAAPLVYPLLSLIPATIFLGFFFLRIRAASGAGLARFAWRSLGAALAWGVYTLYELRMNAWSLSVSGAIRIDLFVVWPALFLISAFAVAGAVRLEKEARGTALPEGAEGLDLRVARRWALAIVAFSVLNPLILMILHAGGLGIGLLPLVLNLGLAYFLAQGYPMARLMVWVRCAFGVFLNLTTGIWKLMAPPESDLKFLGLWALISAIFYLVLGAGLIFSKRLAPALPLVASVRGR